MKYTNLLTGQVVNARYQPAGDAWVTAPKTKANQALRRRLLREECAPLKTTKTKETIAS